MVIWQMRDQLFAHLQTMTLGFFSQAEVGWLISRVMSDVGVMRELITWAILAVSRDVLMLGGIIVVMISMNVRLALLTFIVLPIMVGIAQVWRVRVREIYRLVRAGIGSINAELQESIAGVRVVQSFAREELNYRRFSQEINQNNFEANMAAAKLASLFFPRWISSAHWRWRWSYGSAALFSWANRSHRVCWWPLCYTSSGSLCQSAT